MKTIGIIGGMSAESTRLYYDRLNAEAQRRLGGLHSAQCLIYSVDFAEIEHLQRENRWQEAGTRLADIAKRLELAGADVILLATNTMHKCVEWITSAVKIPVIHIADATAERLKMDGRSRPGLMATGYTMKQAFYVGRLRELHGLDVIVPEEADAEETHRVIYEELCLGVVRDASRERFRQIAGRLVARGADCLVLGCTEVGMLLGGEDVGCAVYDTAMIHADAALDFALK